MLHVPSKNIHANAQRKKKCKRPATMPHTMGLSVWLMPARNNTSATNRHTQRFLWIVVRSDCKKNYVTEINSRNTAYEIKYVTDSLKHSKNSILICGI
jgi:hypothetical protein